MNFAKTSFVKNGFANGINNIIKSVITQPTADTGEVDNVSAAQSLEPYSSNPRVDKSASSKMNGKIDAPVKQGNLGDCALIATVYAMSQTKDGAQAIEDALCSVDDDLEDDVYKVYFKGIDEQFEVTQAEVDKAKTDKTRRYSRGDDDMTILELAMEKAFNESQDEKLREIVDTYSGNEEDKLHGVDPKSVTYLLTGEEMTTADVHTDGLVKKFTPNQTVEFTDSNGQPVTFEAGKNYTLVSCKGNVLTIQDRVSGKQFTVNASKFIEQVYKTDKEAGVETTGVFLSNYEQGENDSPLVFATKEVSKVKAPDGSDVTLWGAHAYSVVSINDGSITLVNPWTTEKEVTVTIESLLALEKYYFYGFEN